MATLPSASLAGFLQLTRSGRPRVDHRPRTATTQSRHPRYVQLNSKAVEVLRDCLARRAGEEEQVFPSKRAKTRGCLKDIRGTWNKAKAAAGIDPGMVLHGLRHTYASQLVQNGTSLFLVRDLLGHRSQATTEAHYAHLSQEPMEGKGPTETSALSSGHATASITGGFDG